MSTCLSPTLFQPRPSRHWGVWLHAPRRWPRVLAASLAGWLAVAPQVRAQQPVPVAPFAHVPDTAMAGVPSAADDSGQAFDAQQQALDWRTALNTYQYGVAQHNCYSTFFVNRCLGHARDLMRATQADIRREQLALDDAKRAARAWQRDQQLALQRAQDQAEAPQRAASEASNEQQYEQKQQQHALDQAQRAADAPQRAANAQQYGQKQQQHAINAAQRGDLDAVPAVPAQAGSLPQSAFQRRLAEAAAQGRQKAQERVDRQQRFAQKQADAAQHKADVEQRQKQAAEKAAQKQQSP